MMNGIGNEKEGYYMIPRYNKFPWRKRGHKTMDVPGRAPQSIDQMINRGWAWIHSLGIFPNYMVTLEIIGRQSRKTISFPLAMTVMDGEQY